ncbi:MAG TPA: DHHA1 domain-containing protein [bacterium]|nr:DHHA1 domain-containing protein [bacterium]
MNGNTAPSVFTSQAKLEELLDALREADSALILTHDNPDPDAVSSASCLSYIISKKLGIKVQIGHGGIIGRAENRTMLRLLKIHATKVSEAKIRKHKFIILMDTQPLTGNNSLPRGVQVKGVIDHHPQRKSTRAQFLDIRPDYGALASLLTEYLFASGLDIPTNLATALFYGIASETQDLGREVADADSAAYLALFPRANKKLLSRIRRPIVTREHFAYLDKAIGNAVTYKHSIATTLGRVDNPDIVAQVADMMLMLRRMTWSLATGRHKDTILVSLRTTRVSGKAGRMARQMIGAIGTAGGHEMVAGGQITSAGMTEKQRDELEAKVVETFFRMLGKPEGGELTPLVAVEKEKEEVLTNNSDTTGREEVNQ